MRIVMDRFREPTAADEMILCAGCQRLVHYEQCHPEENFCLECCAEWCDEDVKAVNE